MKILHIISHGVFMHITKDGYTLTNYDGVGVSPADVGLTTENNGKPWLDEIYRNQGNYEHHEITAFNG